MRLADKNQVDKFSKYQTSADYLKQAEELINQRITLAGEVEGEEDSGQRLTSIEQCQRVRHPLAQLNTALLFIRTSQYLQNNFFFQHRKNNLIDIVASLINKDPFLQYSEACLLTLASQDIIALNLDGYQYFYYKIAHKLNSYSNECQIKQLLNTCQTILKILSRSLSITRKDTSRLIAYENYLQILKIIYTYDKEYLENHREQIEKNIRLYVSRLSQNMMKLRLKLKIEVVRIDQQLTYQLLTHQTILEHFQKYSREATEALSKIIPVLLLETKVHKLSSFVQEKTIYTNQVLKAARYFSLINQYNTCQPDEEDQHDKEKPLLMLLGELCNNNPSLA